MDYILFPLPGGIMATGICVLLPTAMIILVIFSRRKVVTLVTALLGNLGPGVVGTRRRRALSIQVTDRAVAHRALVQHSAAFLDRPVSAVPSTILTRNRHFNIVSAPYGPYWRAARRNLASNLLHPSRLGLLDDTRARVLGDLLRALRSGAPAGESLHFAMFNIAAEMCFGADVVSKLGPTRLRAMQKFNRDLLLAIPSFGVLVSYPRIGKLLYRSRWRQLLALRRQQEESYMALIAEVRSSPPHTTTTTGFKCYVESLLDLRIHEDDGRPFTDGELVSLISEFLGGGTESTGASLEWTMANLVRRPELQEKLRAEVDAAIVCSSREVIQLQEAELSRMPYLKATVLESLRRHPPVATVVRHVQGEEAAEVLGAPSVADVGATVEFVIGEISLDAAAWSDPTDFVPERFMPGGDGEGADLTCTRQLRMMPFGAGRRACPGIAPAMLHLEYFVAHLVREFEWWEADGDDRVDFTVLRGFVLNTMNRPLRARLVPRQQTSAVHAS